MTNKILLDGWNICWKIPQIAQLIPENLESARLRFIQIIKIFFQKKKVNYKIYFDGQPGILPDAYQNRGVDLRFSRNPESADHLIIKFLQKQKKADQWTVVTSDRELSNQCRSLGAAVIESEKFIRKIDKKKINDSYLPEKENPEIPPEELEYWKNIFHKKDRQI